MRCVRSCPCGCDVCVYCGTSPPLRGGRYERKCEYCTRIGAIASTVKRSRNWHVRTRTEEHYKSKVATDIFLFALEISPCACPEIRSGDVKQHVRRQATAATAALGRKAQKVRGLAGWSYSRAAQKTRVVFAVPSSTSVSTRADPATE